MMTNQSLLTVQQIAKILSDKPERVNYVVAKLRIEPTSHAGNIRLFTWRQVTAIRKSLEQKYERVSKCSP